MHQNGKPTKAYEGGAGATTSDVLTFLAYYTANGNKKFCDGKAANSNDKAWAALYVTLDARRPPRTSRASPADPAVAFPVPAGSGGYSDGEPSSRRARRGLLRHHPARGTHGPSAAAPHRAGGDLRGRCRGAMDLVDVSVGGAVVDVTLQAHDEAHVTRLEQALNAADMRVRNTSDRVFLYHLGGKIEVTPRRTVRTRDDMSMAYTPGVGRISTAIAEQPDRAWRLTAKGSEVAIVTDGSAVLGLGNLGPLAALPVMEGKAVIFKQFGNVNAYPICLDVPSTQALIDATLAIAPGFGGINLEDIKAPECFEVERRCRPSWTSRSSTTTSTVRRSWCWPACSTPAGSPAAPSRTSRSSWSAPVPRAPRSRWRCSTRASST